jgi:dihydrofolate synthase/folylpolyglutamate synthase
LGVSLALAGRHQRRNAAVAVALLEIVSSPLARSIPDEAVRAALSRVEWPARLERFTDGDTEILLDAAHNPAGARALAEYVSDIGWKDVTLVFGAMRDKDVRGMLDVLAPLCAAIVCTTAPAARALPASDLAEVASQVCGDAVRIEAIVDPAAALARARQIGRRVVAAGSIFLAGPLRDILR